jgi:membrane-bound lytic murein transglycosylase MltF
MIARVFFIFAMVFSLTEVIVLLSYHNHQRFSAIKALGEWVSKNYHSPFDSFNFGFGRVRSGDKEVKQRVMKISEQINLFDIEKEYNLPKGLLHAVMHQESAGNLNAVSRVGAVGPFQFMDYTAKDYGLITSTGKDNRRNPYKSAVAAARYYRKLITYFDGNLSYAIAAYNAGEGRVSRNASNMERLPEETKNYVKRVNTIIKMYQVVGTDDDENS